MNIVYIDSDFIAVDKPAGMPSAPLNQNEINNAVCTVARDFPEVMGVSGRKSIEGGLLHRLDTATRGILLFARNQTAYDSVSRLQQAGLFRKTYKARCSLCSGINMLLPGFPPLSGYLKSKIPFREKQTLLVQSRFRHYGTGREAARPVTDNSGIMIQKKTNNTLYSTEILIYSIQNNTSSVRCTILSGFKHQVRCHLAWLGLPVLGDVLYNPNYMSTKSDNVIENLAFSAVAVDFFHPSLRQFIHIALQD